MIQNGIVTIRIEGGGKGIGASLCTQTLRNIGEAAANFFQLLLEFPARH